MLLALWLFATMDGVGSARELERLCRRDHAYIWICGGLGMNHTTLASFRVGTGDLLDYLLVHSAVALVHAGVAYFDSVAVDGRRIRASAGAASFRRREALEHLQGEVEAHVEALRAELDTDTGASTRRKKAAQKRAAADRLQRVKSALDAMPAAEAVQDRNAKKKGRSDGTVRTPVAVEAQSPAATVDVQSEPMPLFPAEELPFAEVESGEPDPTAGGVPPAIGGTPAGPTGAETPSSSASTVTEALAPEAPNPSLVARVSTTDPQATRMKMADGGFRPAYNCQSVVDAESTAIFSISIEVTGSDAGLLQDAILRVEARYNRAINAVLADGGYVNLEAVEALEADARRKVYMPPPRPRGKGSSTANRHKRRPNDSAAVGAWRERMGTEAAKAIYKKRAASVELVHARYANRGLNQFRTRGVTRTKCELLLQAIVHNMTLTPAPFRK